MQFLRIDGELFPNNKLELNPIYTTKDVSGSIENPKSDIRVEVLDESGNLLLRHMMPVREYCVFGGSSEGVIAVNGAVPVPVKAARIAIFRRDTLLRELSLDAPDFKVTLDWKPPRSVTGVQTIGWNTTGPGRKSVNYRLQYSNNNGRDWITVVVAGERTKAKVDVDQLPGGKSCLFSVLAAVGTETKRIRSKRFSVVAKPCVVTILQPMDGETIDRDDPVTLIGQGCYLESRKQATEDFEWSSSIDGRLGRVVTLDGVKLSPGNHVLTLKIGTGKRAGTASINVKIKRTRRRKDDF